jgi:hypothetical protein
MPQNFPVEPYPYWEQKASKTKKQSGDATD